MAPRTDLPLNAIRRRVLPVARGFVFVVIMSCTQIHLECERWWCSPRVVSALGMTPEQSGQIERLYEDTLPARRHVSEEIMDLRGQIGKRIDAGDFDDELLRLTEALAKAHSVQWKIDQQMLERTVRALSPLQQEKLTGLTPSRPHAFARRTSYR